LLIFANGFNAITLVTVSGTVFEFSILARNQLAATITLVGFSNCASATRTTLEFLVSLISKTLSSVLSVVHRC
jgi:hypothetical protein